MEGKIPKIPTPWFKKFDQKSWINFFLGLREDTVHCIDGINRKFQESNQSRQGFSLFFSSFFTSTYDFCSRSCSRLSFYCLLVITSICVFQSIFSTDDITSDSSFWSTYSKGTCRVVIVRIPRKNIQSIHWQTQKKMAVKSPCCECISNCHFRLVINLRKCHFLTRGWFLQRDSCLTSWLFIWFLSHNTGMR